MRKSLWFLSLLISISVIFVFCKKGDKPQDHSEDETKQTTEKKSIHFKEQWVYPAPAFDTLLFSYVEEYDPNGNMVEQKKYSVSGEFAIHTIAKYDDHGHEVYKKVTNKIQNTEKEYLSEIEYKDGKKSKLYYQSPDGASVNFYTFNEDGSYHFVCMQDEKQIGHYTYNQNGDLIKSVGANQNIYETIEYDDQGEVLEKVKTVNGEVQRTLSYTNEYYKNGQVKSISVRGRTHDFVYNANGDVETETWYRDGNKSRIIIYKYKYY